MSRLFFCLPDWFAEHTSARIRRAVAFWMGAIVLGPVTFATYPVRSSVSVLWGLSMLALILSCFAMTAAETPVETEE